MYLKPFFKDILLKTEAHWIALARQSEALKLKLLWQHLLQNLNTMNVIQNGT